MHRAFTVHKLNARGMRKAERLASTFDVHLLIVGEILGAGEPRPLTNNFAKCVDHLELASFYAKKELAQLPENQMDPDPPGADMLRKEVAANEAGAQEGNAAPYIKLDSFTDQQLLLELQRRGNWIKR